jgi:uncharacterized protein (TIRG00374 family)
MRQKIALVLKMGISVSLIGYLLYKADISSTLVQLKSSSVKFIGCIYLAIIAMNLAQVFRWFVLLDRRGTAVSFLNLVKYHLIGVFFQSFLPSSMSREFIKAYQLSKITDKKSAFGSIVFGQIMGFGVLFVFVIAAVIARPEILFNRGYTYHVIGVICLFLFFSSIIFSKKVSRLLFGRFQWFSENPLLKKIKEFREVLYNYRYQYRALGLGLFASVVIFFGSVFSIFFSFKAVFFNIPFLVYMIYVPIIFVLMMIPISVNGIGWREGLLLLFLKPWNITLEVLLSSSALFYAVVYSFALLGGIIYLFSNIKGVRRG